jgi:hypothetical protein
MNGILYRGHGGDAPPYGRGCSQRAYFVVQENFGSGYVRIKFTFPQPDFGYPKNHRANGCRLEKRPPCPGVTELGGDAPPYGRGCSQRAYLVGQESFKSGYVRIKFTFPQPDFGYPLILEQPVVSLPPLLL